MKVTKERLEQIAAKTNRYSADVCEMARELLSRQWVACSERLPEDDCFVIVTNGRHIGVGCHRKAEHLEENERWQDEHGEFINLQSKFPVTYWQPLPAPPEPENTDEHGN